MIQQMRKTGIKLTVSCNGRTVDTSIDGEYGEGILHVRDWTRSMLS